MSAYHLDILRAELHRRMLVNPRYSLRSFAKSLEIDPSNLSRVMAQKRTLALSTAEGLADRLKLAPKERKAFLSSVWMGVKTEFLSRSPNIDPHRSHEHISGDFLRIVNDWSDLIVASLSAAVQSANLHRDTEGITGDVSHLPVRAGEPVILTIHGAYGTQFDYRWTTQHGTIFGKGMRVNFQPFKEFSGTAIVEFALLAKNKIILNYQFSIPVIIARPKICVDVIEHDNGCHIDIQGHLRDPFIVAPEDLRIVVYPNSVRRLQTPIILPLDQDRRFSATVTVDPSTDRLLFQLAHRHFQLEDPGRLFVDCYHNTKAYLPFRLNDNNSFSYTLHHRPLKHTHQNQQIESLLNRFLRTTIRNATAPAGLLQSFRSHDLAYVYDQALAILAFSHANQQQSAIRILTALAHLQIKDGSETDGAWYASYLPNGQPLSSAIILHDAKKDVATDDATRRLMSGNIAWVTLAAIAYQDRFGDTSFQPMAERALRYLMRQSQPVSYLDVESVGIRVRPPQSANPSSCVLSAQHNIVAHAAFRNAGNTTRNHSFITHAASLLRFVDSIWDDEIRGFYAGYDTIKSSPNLSDAHMDPQSLAILALGRDPVKLAKYRPGLNRIFDLFFEPAGYLGDSCRATPGFFDWRPMKAMVPNLSRQFVWCEGTLSVVLAMRFAEQHLGETIRFRRHGQTYDADTLLNAMNQFADSTGALPYCTANAIRDDFQPEASAASTAWLYFANHNLNPFDPYC